MVPLRIVVFAMAERRRGTILEKVTRGMMASLNNEQSSAKPSL
jgi:hypothetical protein